MSTVGPAVLRIEWEDNGFTGTEAVGLACSLAEKISDLKEVYKVNVRTYNTLVSVPERDESVRAALAKRALGPWGVKRSLRASEEVEELAQALLAAEEELARARKAMDAYDRAELSLCRERDELADRLRFQLASAINSEATLILHELDPGLKSGIEGWLSALVVVTGVLAGANTEVVARCAHVTPASILPLAARLRDNGLWEAGQTLIDADLEDAGEVAIWVWLASLVADGELVRVIENGTEGYKRAKPTDQPAP